MQRRYHKIFSPAIGREMELLEFGHAGTPIIAFPTGGSPFYELENNGMVNALAPLLDEGKIRLYLTSNIDTESWLHNGLDPHWRGVRHHAYQDFMMNNLVPYIRQDCADPKIRIALMGSDFGAYHAINFALKYPKIFHYALGMSGRYDIDAVCGRYSESLDVYYNNPVAYVPNLEGRELKKVQTNSHYTLVCGQGTWDETSLSETQRLADLFTRKKIKHTLDIWGHDVTPDWHWWQKQAFLHLDKALVG